MVAELDTSTIRSERRISLQHNPHQPPPAPTQPVAPVRPRLRGVFHQYGFFAALVAGTILVVGAPTPTAALAAAIYAASVCALFGMSALYHRITWTPPVRRRLRHLDHAAPLRPL